MKYVRISVAQLAELLRNNHELVALENWGVDNWIGYGDHHSEDNEWEDWDDLSNEDVVTMNGFEIRDTDDLIG
jgi:hypothetical protein